MKQVNIFNIAFILAIFIVSSCSMIASAVYIENKPEENYREIKQNLLQGARLVLGKKEVTIKNRSFMADCMGAVRAIYYYAGIDLARDFNKYSGNGVRRLFYTLKERGLIHTEQVPRPGDIIFWDNTWDRNGDGQWNDPLTHVGMVVKVYKDGQFDYIHQHYQKGNKIAKMNLLYPDSFYIIKNKDTIILNTPMRMKESGEKHPDKWLSSHLFRAFGRGYGYRY